MLQEVPLAQVKVAEQLSTGGIVACASLSEPAPWSKPTLSNADIHPLLTSCFLSTMEMEALN